MRSKTPFAWPTKLARDMPGRRQPGAHAFRLDKSLPPGKMMRRVHGHTRSNGQKSCPTETAKIRYSVLVLRLEIGNDVVDIALLV